VGDGAALVALSARLAATALAAAFAAQPALAQRAMLPHPSCVSRSVVPPLAPDTVAERVLDSLGTVTSPARPGMRYIRNLLAARFDSTASPSQRQAAIDQVCGVVVGGDHSDGETDGYYLVRLPNAESVSALDAAADAMRHMPGVSSAQTLALRRVDAEVPEDAGTMACATTASGGMIRVEAVKEMLASRAAADVAMMTRLGLSGVDSNTVHVESDDRVCRRVAAAIEGAVHFAPDGVPFLVLRAGPRYVAFDPSGANRSFFLVDTAFVFRTILR
jgi:hypothetical protein